MPTLLTRIMLLITFFLFITFFTGWFVHDALAWQNPCSTTQHNYTYNGYILTGWTDTESNFSPAPRCSGTVLLLASDSTWLLLNYASYKDTILINNTPCRISDNGNLVCKVITQPEKSFNILFSQE